MAESFGPVRATLRPSLRLSTGFATDWGTLTNPRLFRNGSQFVTRLAHCPWKLLGMVDKLSAPSLLEQTKRLRWRELRESYVEWMRRVRMGEIEPERFSRSVALGVFIGLLPIHGLQTLLWLGLIVVVPVEPMLTWLCSWVGNAATAVPLTWLELELGSYLCSGRFAALKLSQIGDKNLLSHLSLTLLVGALAFATAGAALAYGGALWWVSRNKSRLGNAPEPGV
jgi:uncharacterized protein (DUF2062 family)